MPSCLDKFSGTIVGGLERFFYNYGYAVAVNPYKVIILCIAASGICGIGLLEFRTENNAFKLWIPKNSDFAKNNEWLEENFPPDARYNNIILSGDDVLYPETLKRMLEIHLDVAAVNLTDGKSWTDLCQQIPVIEVSEDISPGAVPPTNIGLDDYCDYVEAITNYGCLETSILELWGYDPAVYDSLTREQILAKVNEPEPMSVVLNRPLDLSQLLSLELDTSSGQIIAAKAATMSWIGQVDTSNLEDLSSSGTGLPVDPDSLEFESALQEIFEQAQADLAPEGIDLYINVARAYEDLAEEFILDDALYMPIGFMIVFVYVMVMLGKFDRVETRAFLSLVGVFCIGLTILVSYGLCSAFQLAYGPMHNVIPFLLLGIGIDDMFVIMQCFDNLDPSLVASLDAPSAIGLTMKHAGVAITVTSITDFIVFGVGATTSLPALQSFCLFCAVGIIAVYILQATLFVACLSLDLRRIEQGRNGLFFCYKHKNYERKLEKPDYISQRIFKKIGKTITKTLVQILLLLATAGFLAFGIWGTTRLEVRFESVWFLPPDSFLVQWFEAKESLFPSEGELVTVYMTDLDYPSEMGKIEGLVDSFEEADDIITSVDSWYPGFKTFFNDIYLEATLGNGSGIPELVLPDAEFNFGTSLFLYSPGGSRWQPNFYLQDELQCGQPVSKILMTTFTFVHALFNGPSEHVPAMNEVKDLIEEQQFSANVFALSGEYANWETDEVIEKELYRNLGLSIACIFVTTIVLLANVLGSVLVMLSVIMTLVNVLGFMQFWGLTIDVVSSITVIISIGLCVDYSAHIASTFLTMKGSRRDRSVATLHNIGPAVLNGGISTFIALILLAGSDSHVFSSFFKIFLLVILFGLFHGLIFLPIMLSLFGPRPYSHHDEEENLDCSEEKDSDAKPITTHI